MDVTEPKTTTQTYRTIIEIPEFANANLIQSASQYAIIVRRKSALEGMKRATETLLLVKAPPVSSSTLMCMNRVLNIIQFSSSVA